MRIDFEKYHGTGNDFIIIDDRQERFDAKDEHLISQLCRRRFGIGADGCILIRNHDSCGFEMVYFNADGKIGSMCGNGGRCAVAFAHKKGIVGKVTTFMAYDGEHHAEVISDGLIKLKMGAVRQYGKVKDGYVLNTGSPHYVTYCDKLSSVDVEKEGRDIRNSPQYAAEGINVNFVEEVTGGIHVRTYERGVESETFSCGTGVVASALSTALKRGMNGLGRVIEVQTTGGALKVYFDHTNGAFDNIFLEGPAQYVFSGYLDI